MRAPAFSNASEARSGSSSPVINSASPAPARTSSASGTQAFVTAAASARERHRCRRTVGSNTTGRPSDSASSRTRIVISRCSAPTSVPEPKNSAAEFRTASSIRASSAASAVTTESPYSS